jgi:lysophospholipase L1-like esterase
MTHIVLLGDSIFDNAAYVAGAPDVVRQVHELLPSGWRATLNALDGAVIADVSLQLQRLPTDPTHLVVSVGGNDALGEAALLDRKVGSMAEALELITQVRERFRSAYARMLDQVLERRLPLAVCTIYEPRFPEPVRRRLAATALTALNDAITREAFARNVDCIDLRLICDDDRDFANPIEPSVHGGSKIAQAILGFATAEPARRPRKLSRGRR